MNNIIIITIYINDILFIDLDKKKIQNIKNKLNKKFKIIDFEFYIYYFKIIIVKNHANRILRFN